MVGIQLLRSGERWVYLYFHYSQVYFDPESPIYGSNRSVLKLFVFDGTELKKNLFRNNSKNYKYKYIMNPVHNILGIK